MDIIALRADWEQEARQPFQGWDFSYLSGRMIEEPLPWSYPERASALMGQATRMLDLGTGGGEHLLELYDSWPGQVVVTEEYPPNVRLATQRLATWGVSVVNVALSRTSILPFTNGTFDLVINRHAGFNPTEVARILVSGGTFFTQQVHGRSLEDLQAHFGARPQWPDSTSETYVPLLNAAGMVMTTVEEWVGSLVFTDVGAIVFYLTHIPWLVPGFSVATHWDPLLALHQQVNRGEPLAFCARSYLLEAKKA